VFGSPMKLSRTPPQPVGEAPWLGQHNCEVYVEWLGIAATGRSVAGCGVI
jgi:crotonobetainyl-CoA:carnitine CoA-transferase CaiB-like acyl-CoA transferase